MSALTVPTIFTAVDKLSSVISKMQGNVSKFASETQKKYAEMSRSAQEWQTNFSQIGMAAGIAGAAIIAPLGFAVKAASEFEDQMANVATLVDTSKESIKDMGKQVLDVFTKAPVKLDDLTEALYKIRSAGIPAAQAMDVLSKSAILGVAGRGSTLQAGDAITSAINVFKDEGLSTNKIASMLFETVKQGKTTIEGMSESFGATANIVHNGGVKLNDFLSATAAMTVMGEPASQAMNQIRASVFGLEKPTTRMKFLFKSLGVHDVKDLISKFGNLGNAMGAIEDRGKKLGVNMGQAWGKVGAYAAVIALTGNSKGAYNTNLLAMAHSDADLAAGYADKLNTMKAQSQLLQNELQYLGITVGTALLPSLKSLITFLVPVIQGFAQWIEQNPGLAGGIIKTTAVVGALLVVLAPIAFILSGIAGAWKIYAGIQLLATQRTLAAAAAIEIENAAAGSAGVAVASLGATTATAAGGFSLISTAATGFLAVLGRMLGPLGLLFIAYKNIGDIMDHIHDNEPLGAWGSGYHHKMTQAEIIASNAAARKRFLHPKVPDIGFRPFTELPQEKARRDSLMGTLLPALNVMPTAPDASAKNDPNIIHITVDDKGHIITGVTHNGKPIIPHSLHQGSTTGNK